MKTDNPDFKQETNIEELLRAYGINIPDPKPGTYNRPCPGCGKLTDIYINADYLFGKCSCHWQMYKPIARETDPVDLWEYFATPALPRGLLPATIEQFAFTQGTLMGADPAGLAMAALAVCAAAIPDHIMLQPKKHDTNWVESARIWVAVVGVPSTKKTPVMTQAIKPLFRIDARMGRDNAEARKQYEKLPPEQRKLTPSPPQPRLKLDDTTMEAAQEVLKDSLNGVLCVQDELGGWFGGMDRYTGGHRSAMKDRSFWMRAFNGGEYSVNRIGRGNFEIPNLSVCILGGIQPDAIRLIASETVDDGLLQRLCPIMLHEATMGTDRPIAKEVRSYDELVEKLHEQFKGPKLFLLAEDALPVRERLEKTHLEWQNIELVNKRLSAHIGKYDGLFARLCVIWHCIEHVEQLSQPNLFGTDKAPRVPTLQTHVNRQTAERVANFMHQFLFKHAVAFYGMLGLSDEHDRLQKVAGFILARELTTITKRDVQLGDRTMRKFTTKDIENVFAHLEAFGWVERMPGARRDSYVWGVNPNCHRLFAERARMEEERRQKARDTIKEATSNTSKGERK